MYPSTIMSEDFGVIRSTREQRRGGAVLIESAEIAACSEKVERLTGISINEMKDADIRWWQSMTAFFQAGRHDGERVLWELPVSAWLVRADGRMWMPADRPLLRFPGLTETAVRKHDPTGELIAVPAECMVAAFALSLLHCRRTAIQLTNPPQRMSKAFSRRHGRPLTNFRTIEIEAMQQVFEAEGSIRKTGLKAAVHMCRGHFKDYRWGAGLFGKHHGTFWWSDFKRGGTS